MTADPDQAARRALARHRVLATLLLLFMAALTLIAYALPPGPWRDALEAAARSGFVGGIADWFAVSALFRHPLGLPIPHTAIIPREKERLGQALGRFVATHVFTEAELHRVIAGLDVSGILARYLADPATARPAAQTLAELLPRLLASVEDGRARRLLSRLLPRLVSGQAGGLLAARILHSLVEGGRHQAAFSFLLDQLRFQLAGKEAELRAAIEERVREQGGRLLGWALGASIARRVIAAVNAELDRMGPEGSSLREAFDEWVRREVARLESDPERLAELGAAMRRLVADERVQTWLWDIWARLRKALEADAARPSGRTVAIIEGSLANLGGMLAEDPVARERLARAVQNAAASLIPSARAEIAGFIAGVIAHWDTATLTERLELRVGKDLQYVRVNGTLVGFLVGGGAFLALRAMFPGVVP